MTASHSTSLETAGSPPRFLPARSLYVHVPFCRRRCGYCDFSLVAGRDYLIDGYLAALEREAARYALPQPLETAYFGGGTPSRLDRPHSDRLLKTIAGRFHWTADSEVTMEVNPEDLSEERIEWLRQRGINRLSLGVQSFDRNKLQRLERAHDPHSTRRWIDRLAGDGWNVCLDLIFGLAGESPAVWQNDLDTAIASGANHLSTYDLTIERGTAFFARHTRGESMTGGESLSAELYERAIECLGGSGWEHYEVSNFARPGLRSRHNLVYWTRRPCLGLGPGASSFDGRERWRNHAGLIAYERAVTAGRDPAVEREALQGEAAARERLIFGLRVLEGIALPAFAAETGFPALELGGEPLRRWLAEGWVCLESDRLKLTRRGLMISDALWPELL